MDSNYLTKEEFNKYIADLAGAINNYNNAFLDATETIKTLTTKIREQEEYIQIHEELFHKYAEVQNANRQAMRFLDWTGSGNFFDPVNIGISLSYDKFNRDIEFKHHSKSKSNSGRNRSGCLTSILTFIGVTFVAGFAITILA